MAYSGILAEGAFVAGLDALRQGSFGERLARATHAQQWRQLQHRVAHGREHFDDGIGLPRLRDQGADVDGLDHERPARVDERLRDRLSLHNLRLNASGTQTRPTGTTPQSPCGPGRR